ncbi:hypothetical protein BTVI_13660 [Pitangus sulphuratus]|nr:hypothetical protein BTVI_13660 [Pitangus sulphuratus]
MMESSLASSFASSLIRPRIDPIWFHRRVDPGHEALNHGEQSSLLEQEQINNKEPTLIETIFTVLSYCTLSPKSLGIAFETYMEKEHLWNCLYSMTGFTRLAAQAVSIVISKLPTVIACLPPPIKYFFFLAERKMSRNFAELKKAGLLVWNLILIICRIFEDGNTAELLTGATLDRWSKEKLSLVRVCLESIMGKQKSGPKQVTQKIIQNIEQQRPNWIESQLLKARKLSTDCASNTVEGATLEEGGIALGFAEQKINMMVLDICHKPGGSEYLRQIYHIIQLNELMKLYSNLKESVRSRLSSLPGTFEALVAECRSLSKRDEYYILFDCHLSHYYVYSYSISQNICIRFDLHI